MLFNEMLRERRLELGYGVRETARLTRSDCVPSPISSAVYISRIESGDSVHMPVESVTIDKLWALGVVLKLNPLLLFLKSRGRDDLVSRIDDFAVRSSRLIGFGTLVRNRRRDLDLTLREAAEKCNSAGWYVSHGYLSQVETDFRAYADKISGEKLWTIGSVLDIDPLLLYVVSRGVDPLYLDAAERDALFTRTDNGLLESDSQPKA